MDVPFVNLGLQYIFLRNQILEKFDEISKKGEYILGSELEKFEHEFANYCGTKFAIGVGNGSDALSLSMIALGIKKDDEVIIPGNSFHSEYLPSRYQLLALFQAFEVSHKIDSSGWTTTLRGIMRSTLARVFNKSLADYQKTSLDNYRGKVKQEQISHDKNYQEEFGSLIFLQKGK